LETLFASARTQFLPFGPATSSLYLDAFEMPRVAATRRMEIMFCGRTCAAHSAVPMKVGQAPSAAGSKKNELSRGQKRGTAGGKEKGVPANPYWPNVKFVN